MKENKIITDRNSEFIYNPITENDTNQNFLHEFNIELADKATNCRREFEVEINTDIYIDKIASLVSLVVGMAACIISIILSIMLDWGFWRCYLLRCFKSD